MRKVVKNSILIFSMIILLMLSGCEKKAEDINTYLKKNVKEVNLENPKDYSEFELINSDIHKSKVILLGEGHGSIVNFQVSEKFINYMRDKENLKYILVEYPYVCSVYMNKYLATGEETYLKDLGLPDEETIEMVRKVYEINSTLKDKDKIRFIGIDTGYTLMSLEYLTEELSQVKDEDNIKNDLEKLNEIRDKYQEIAMTMTEDTSKYLDAKNLYNEFYSNMNKKLYKETLGEKEYVDFSLVADSIYKNLYYSNFEDKSKTFEEVSEELYNNRDLIIYENFKNVYEHFKAGKYFGKFGGQHVWLKEDKSQLKSFAAYLKEDNDINLTTITMVYDNCQVATPYFQGTYTDYIKNDAIDKVITADASLIKVKGKTSPYNSSLESFSEKIFQSKGVTTDFYEYIILAKNSKAVKVIE